MVEDDDDVAASQMDIEQSEDERREISMEDAGGTHPVLNRTHTTYPEYTHFRREYSERGVTLAFRQFVLARNAA